MKQKVPVAKGEVIETDIVDLAYGGDSISKYRDFTVFIPYGVPGARVSAEILEVKRNFASGRIKKIIRQSNSYVKPECPYFGICGGCDWLNIDYKKQVEYKGRIVENLLSRIAGIPSIKVRQPIIYENPFHYRNRAQYKLKYQNKRIKLGFFKARSHEVIAIDHCFIINNEINKIAKIIESALNDKKKYINLYNEKNKSGYLRYITVKVNSKDESLITFVVAGKEKKEFINYVSEILKNNISRLKGIVLNINRSEGNLVFGEKAITIYGAPYIIENYADLDFVLGSSSFFQINFIVFQKMAEYIKNNATYGINVLDLYGGVGALSLPLRHQAREITIIDNDKSNIENLKITCRKNNLKNVYPVLANAEDVIKRIIYERKINEAIVDPPRKGLHPKVLFVLKNSNIKNIIYISCNPSTFARDMKELKEKYYLEEVTPIDQFAHTYHIELIAKLRRKNKS